jgi:hypothetical protein
MGLFKGRNGRMNVKESLCDSFYISTVIDDSYKQVPKLNVAVISLSDTFLTR